MNWMLMKEFLEQNKSIYTNLNLSQIIHFINVLVNCKLRSKDYIRQRYEERERNFEKTIGFLTSLGLVRSSNKTIHLLVDQEENNFHRQAQFKQTIISKLLRNESQYKTELLRYLRLFKIQNGQPVFQPNARKRNKYSFLRNLLMELGLISYYRDSDYYVLDKQYLSLYALLQKSGQIIISPSQFEIHRQQKESLGIAAEKRILEFEKERVGSHFCNEVTHVATTNVAAGYDISSITFIPEGSTIPRYIEVKAVPHNSHSFYWSKNERKVAEVFRSWYFLYLLPFDKKRGFQINDLRIVKDPIESILGSTGAWVVEDDVLYCFLKKEKRSK